MDGFVVMLMGHGNPPVLLKQSPQSLPASLREALQAGVAAPTLPDASSTYVGAEPLFGDAR